MAHARVAPRTHHDPPGAGVGAAGRPSSPHAPRSTSMPHARIAPHAPQTVQPAATAPRVPASGSAPRLCLLVRARHPIGVHCTRSVQVYCSPSGVLLPIGCTSVRARSPLSHSASHRVRFCPGVLLPIGHSAPHRALCPSSAHCPPHRVQFRPGALPTIGCSASHRARCPLSGSPLPIRCTTPVHPAETTSRGSGDRARHTPWLA